MAKKTKMNVLTAPVASDDVTVKADFLELESLRVADRDVSLQDLTMELKRSGSVDAIGDPEAAEYAGDRGTEMSQSLAEDAFSELEDRHHSCGGDACEYPFNVEKRVLKRVDNAIDSIYIFLLLLSEFGIGAGPKNTHGERIFEDICRHAAENYFGGKAHGASAEHFGFPRRILPKHFPNALQVLASRVGDFIPNDAAPRNSDQKDAKLDIVAWKSFPDRRPGKLLAFGQCAAGRGDLASKIHELQVRAFCVKWLREHPSVEPVRLFFVPWRVNSAEFRNICVDGGIVFDRCRVSYFCNDIDAALREQCRKWSEHVLKTRLTG